MNRIIFLLALLAPLGSGSMAAPPVTNSASANRVLIIDPSSMPIAAGKATLTIGSLQRTNGIYSGDYKVSVTPYFFKNEKGRLAIAVSDESLTKASQGKIVAITGTATTSGDNGKARHIDATATPASTDHGKLKLWFMSGDRKMIFEPAYHFADIGARPSWQPGGRDARAPNLVSTTETNLVSNIPRRLPISHREALEISARRPSN